MATRPSAACGACLFHFGSGSCLWINALKGLDDILLGRLTDVLGIESFDELRHGRFRFGADPCQCSGGRSPDILAVVFQGGQQSGDAIDVPDGSQRTGCVTANLVTRVSDF